MPSSSVVSRRRAFFAFLLLLALCALPLRGQSTVQITSLSPDIPLEPGDHLTLKVTAGYGGAPAGARLGLILVETSAKGTKEFAGGTVSVTGTSGSRPLELSYRLPQLSCHNISSSTTPTCANQAPFSSTVTKLSSLQAVVKMFTSGGAEITSASRNMPLQYPEVTSVSVTGQPMQSEQPIRIVVKDAKFTDAATVNASFYRQDMDRVFSGSFFRGFEPSVCKPLPEGDYSGICEFKVIDDTTIEVKLRTVMTGFPEAEVLANVGFRDVVISWGEQTKPHPDVLRNPMAAKLGAYNLTAPLTDDLTQIEKLTVIVDTLNPDPAKRKPYTLVPGVINVIEGASDVYMQVNWVAKYKLSRLGRAKYWVVVREKGKTPNVANYDYYVWNTFGKTIDAKYFNHTFLPIENFVKLPPGDSDLEMFVVMTDEKFENPNQESFARSQIISVSRRVPDLTVDHIEVVQTVQDPANSVKLVAGKKTVARVFVKIGDQPTGPVADVTGVLKGVRNGTELTATGLKPMNVPTKITVPNVTDRANQNQSLNFEIPDSWALAGSTILRAELNPERTVNESNYENNKGTYEYEAVFTDRNTLRVFYVPVCYGKLPYQRCPRGTLSKFGAMAEKLFPLAKGNFIYKRLPVKRPWNRPEIRKAGPGEKQKDVTDAWTESFLTILRMSYDLLEGEKRPDQLVAWLPPVYRGLADGLSDPKWAKKLGRVTFAQDHTDIVAPRTKPSLREESFTLAHELAHNLGLRHTNTKDGCPNMSQDPGTDWPHSNGRIQEVGFDTEFKTVVPPTRFDLMTYCPAAQIWLAPFSFKKLYEGNLNPRKNEEEHLDRPAELEEPGREEPVEFAGVELPSEAPHAGALEYLLIAGSAASDGSRGQFNLGYRVSSSTPGDPSLPQGNHCLRISSNAGVLSSHCFDLEFHDHRTGEPVAERSFSLKVPFPEGAVQISLLAGGRELTTLRASARTPAVTITSPQPGQTWKDTQKLSWSAIDADGAQLTYVTQYSPDGGNSWYPMEVGITETETVIDAADLAAGSQTYFRVLASDGLNTGSATVGPVIVERSANVAVTPRTLDFGSVSTGQSRELVLEVRNLGTQPLVVTGSSTNSTRFSIASELPLTVAAEEEDTIVVSYQPASAASDAGSLTLTTSDATQPSIVISLSGRGVTTEAARAEFVPALLDFGPVTVGSSSLQSVVVSNSGNAPLRIQSAAVDGAAFALPQDSTEEIPAYGSESIPVRFLPTAAGSSSATLRINTSDPGRAILTIALAGSGVGMPVIQSLSPENAAPGATLTVAGTNFSSTAADNVVWFGTIPGKTLTATSTRLGVQVPEEVAAGEVLVTAIVTGRSSNQVRFVVGRPTIPPDRIKHFAQFGNGGQLISSLVLTNPSATRTATALVAFANDAGQPLSVSLNRGAPASSSTVSIPPLGSATLTTDGAGGAVTGSARVESNIPIGGIVKFSFPGLGIAGVGESTPAGSLILPVVRDAARGLNTGVAVSNVEASDQVVQFSLRGLDGIEVSRGATVLSLAPNGHVARFVDELFPQAETANFQGTMVVSTGAQGRRLAATALQLGRSAGDFTTLPVVGIEPQSGSTSLTFAQFGNGSGLASSFFLVNPLNTPATGEMAFFNDQGSPVAAALNGGPASERAIFSIQPLGGVVFTTDGTGTPVAGSARVSSSGAIGGVLRFTFPGIGLAGVGSSVSMSGFISPVRRSVAAGISTGVAIAADSASRIQLTLRSSAGQPLTNGQISLTLPASGHLARFIHELFPQAGTAEFEGSLTVSVEGGKIAATALELGSKPGEFTTLPVTALTDPPVVANPAPSITTLAPNSATAGGAAFSLTVRGENFVSGSQVRWNSSERSTTYVSPSELRAAISAADISGAGSASITVFSPAPGGGVSNVLAFGISAVAAPSVAVTPSSLDFGTVTVGQSRDLILTIRNAGNAALRVQSLAGISAPFTLPVPVETPLDLAPQQERQVTIRFAPSAAGAASSGLNVVTSDPARPTLTVLLSGTAISAGTAPTISNVTVTRQVFGNVDISLDLADPDGDITRIDFDFYQGGVRQVTRSISSPGDRNLAGVTSGTQSFSFGLGPAGSGYDRVDIQATDSRGNRSSVVSKAY